VFHEVVVLLRRIDRQQTHHPHPKDAEEVGWRDVVDVLEEEEREVVELELANGRGTMIRKTTIFRKGLRLTNAFVSR
jgi:hypothetical protein